MPYYTKLGQLPKKRHVQFRRPDGALYSEELFGTEGFVGPTSTLYRIHPPTQVSGWKTLYKTKPEYVETEVMRMRHLKSQPMATSGDAVTGRVVILGNSDVEMSLCQPAEQMAYHFKNGQGDELLFFHYGSGTAYTMFGTLKFARKDYLLIPKGTIYKLVFDERPDDGSDSEDFAGCSKKDMPYGKFVAFETANASHIGPPPRYVSKTTSQFLEHAPYCERDLRIPFIDDAHPIAYDEAGDYEVRIKARDCVHSYIYPYHPLDVVGWDGCYYPYCFNIDDFAPITGKLHMPPPIHQTFEAHNFVICSFCPRMLDYHEGAIPVPYNHSNIDSDEVLYYVEGNYKARRGIESGSISLHPQGIPHGPHPGTVEASLGKTFTDELAVMCDTFRPLFPTKAALGMDDPTYPESWRADHHAPGQARANGQATGGADKPVNTWD
ncbi:MAG: homogentisate 1,2-dioxygenase [Phycisphaeraceae bacterium]|nr:MAG: homogentisate 1,2-dioxygenase [Phycisphaeraceae bacterium]